MLQNANLEQEVIHLSKEKWDWMAARNLETLDALFHEKSVFVHMGGSWGKAREMEIIKSGRIHYNKRSSMKSRLISSITQPSF